MLQALSNFSYNLGKLTPPYYFIEKLTAKIAKIHTQQRVIPSFISTTKKKISCGPRTLCISFSSNTLMLVSSQKVSIIHVPINPVNLANTGIFQQPTDVTHSEFSDMS